MPEKYHDAGDIDLDAEAVYTKTGKRLTEADAEEWGEDAIRRVAGRPSLTGSGKHSPQIAYRVPEQLASKARSIAEREGKTLSEVGREALEEYIKAHI